MYIKFVTFDGASEELPIESDKPRSEYEETMIQVFHRHYQYVEAVILEDDTHHEVCRFQHSHSLYSQAAHWPQKKTPDKPISFKLQFNKIDAANRIHTRHNFA